MKKTKREREREKLVHGKVIGGEVMCLQTIKYLRKLVEERQKRKGVSTRGAVSTVAPVLTNARMDMDRSVS